jgi:hypothetical protein
MTEVHFFVTELAKAVKVGMNKKVDSAYEDKTL